MPALVSFASTLLGGFLAAGSGYLLQRHHRAVQDAQERESWERQLNHLLRQYKHDLDGDGTPASADAVSDLKEQADFKQRTAVFIDELGEHLARAPATVPDEVWAGYTSLRIYTDRVQTLEKKSGDYVEYMARSQRTAEEIEAWAADALAD